MTAGALLVLSLLGPAAADLGNATPQDQQVILIQEGQELGFFDEYFPLSLADNLDPSTDDLVVPFWLSTLFLPFGWLWAPYVFADVKPGQDYLVDALLIAVFHALASACLIPIAIIPIIGWILFIPIMIFNIINGWYLMPVAFLNAYDRSIKNGGTPRAGPGEGTPKKKRRRRRSREEASLTQRPSLVMAF